MRPLIGLAAWLAASGALTQSAMAQAPLAGLPPVAEDRILNSDWNSWAEGSRKFDAVLQRKFPPGSDEEVLVKTLLQQDFRYARPARPGCIDSKTIMPVGVSYVPCPTHDPKHVLIFEWKPRELPFWIRFACEQSVSVSWDSKDGMLTAIKGYYDGFCP